jgi:hypothetical protein
VDITSLAGQETLRNRRRGKVKLEETFSSTLREGQWQVIAFLEWTVGRGMGNEACVYSLSGPMIGSNSSTCFYCGTGSIKKPGIKVYLCIHSAKRQYSSLL